MLLKHLEFILRVLSTNNTIVPIITQWQDSQLCWYSRFISGVQTLALMNYTKWTWISYCSAGSYQQNCGLLHLSKDQFVPWEYQLSYFKVTVLSQGDSRCSKYDSKFMATGSWEFTVKLLTALLLHFHLHHGYIFLFTRPIDLYFHLYRYYLLMFSFSTLLLFVIYNIIIVF